VRVIDGTGAPPREDQTVVISEEDRAVGPSASTPVPQGAVVLQREGGTVLPGWWDARPARSEIWGHHT